VGPRPGQAVTTPAPSARLAAYIARSARSSSDAGVSPPRGHADRHADLDHVAAGQRDGHLHGVADAAGHGRGRVGVERPLAHHDELVAGVPGHDVLDPDRVLQAGGHLDEDGVARLVAERVVDVLEAVEVAEQQRRAGPADADAVVEQLGELGPVGQAGELVVQGPQLEPLVLLAQPLLGLAAGGHVLEVQHDVADRAVGAPHDRRRDRDPQQSAVGPGHLLLGPDPAHRAGAHAGEPVGHGHGDGARQHLGEGAADEVGLGAPDELGGDVVGPHDVAVGGEQHRPARRLGEDLLEPRLGVGQLGDVPRADDDARDLRVGEAVVGVHLDHAHRAVGVADAAPVPVRRLGARHQRGEPERDGADVLGVDELEPGRPDREVAVDAERPVEGLVGEADDALGVDEEDEVVDAVDERPEP